MVAESKMTMSQISGYKEARTSMNSIKGIDDLDDTKLTEWKRSLGNHLLTHDSVWSASAGLSGIKKQEGFQRFYNAEGCVMSAEEVTAIKKTCGTFEINLWNGYFRQEGEPLLEDHN